MSEKLINMIATFAEKGVPESPSGVAWPKYTSASPVSLLLSNGNDTEIEAFGSERCQFWSQHIWQHWQQRVGAADLQRSLPMRPLAKHFNSESIRGWVCGPHSSDNWPTCSYESLDNRQWPKFSSLQFCWFIQLIINYWWISILTSVDLADYSWRNTFQTFQTFRRQLEIFANSEIWEVAEWRYEHRVKNVLDYETLNRIKRSSFTSWCHQMHFLTPKPLWA